MLSETVFSLRSWAWSAACCRWAPASVPRQLRSRGCPSSRTWSCLADWPWGSAPALTAPPRWAARHVRLQLPENPTIQHVTPVHVIPAPRPPSPPWSATQQEHLSPCHHICLNANNSDSSNRKLHHTLFRVARHKSCTATFLSEYTRRYILLPRFPVLIALTNERIF